MFDVAAQRVDEVVAADRQRVAVAGHHPDVEVGPGHGQAGGDGRRPTVDRVHPVRVHVVREPGRAADAGHEHGVLAAHARGRASAAARRRGSSSGRVHEVLLRLRVLNTTELDRLTFNLNGTPLPDSALRKLNEMYKMSAPRYRVFGYWFIYKLNADQWPRQGRNSVSVTLVARDQDVTLPIVLRDVELEIKYLMGKNFGRGQEADVGDFECRV